MNSKCPKCLYPYSHSLGLTEFSDECSGCFTYRERESIDWDFRLNLFREKIKKYSVKKRTYDCVVPVVGDAEDFFVLNKVLELGLTPLVVSVNNYFKNNIGWHNLHQLITYFDVDSLVYNPEVNVYKELIRTSLRKFNHVYLPFLQLHTSFPVHVAVKRNIPLIIWGQHQAVEQVGKFSYYDEVEMTKWGRREHDLFGVDIARLVGNGAQVNEDNLVYYEYPRLDMLTRNGVRGVYLSNYIRWDPVIQNRSTVDFGFMPERNFGSYDIFERAGCSVYYGIHDLLKLKRVGYRKGHDHLARDIRRQHVDAEEADELSDIILNSTLEINSFFKWLGVTGSGYKWFVDERLKPFQSMIGEGDSSSFKSLSGRLFGVEGDLPQEKFIEYGKGI